MKKEVSEEEARKRAEMIFKVRSGLLTAKDAAKQLEISRKTYYKWEERALTAMVGALQDRRSGRPSQPIDGEKTNMKEEIKGLEKALLLSEQRMHARSFLLEDEEMQDLALKALRKKKEHENGKAG